MMYNYIVYSVCIYIYIFIVIERDMHYTYNYISIYIYIYIYVSLFIPAQPCGRMQAVGFREFRAHNFSARADPNPIHHSDFRRFQNLELRKKKASEIKRTTS